jgi:outer membrane protein assembly factor BamB
MKKIIFLYIFLSVLFSTCSIDTGNTDNNDNIIPTLQMEDSIIISIPYLWKHNIHGNQPMSNSIIRAHLVYNGNPIIATTSDNERWISMLDIDTGEELWKWNDIYEAPTEKFNIKSAYIYNNLMIYQVGTRSYSIDLDNGNTYWKYRGNKSFIGELTGFGETYFLIGPGDTLQNYFINTGFRASINDGQNKEEYLYTDIQVDYSYNPPRATSLLRIQPYQKNNKTYLIVASFDPYPNWNANMFIGLYDYDNSQWIYNRKIVDEPNVSTNISNIRVINNNIYLDGAKSMNCHNLWTGERIWKSSMSSILLASDFIVEQGKVIAADEDEIVYCWDAETGTELWRAPGAGTSSELRYLNGIVYFSGGSTGRIHGIDIETGKTVWLLKPELMDGTDDFKPDIYAIEGKNGEKGKLVICTHSNAFCVEAYQ